MQLLSRLSYAPDELAELEDCMMLPLQHPDEYHTTMSFIGVGVGPGVTVQDTDGHDGFPNVP
jgi:hypothetical protein